MSHTVVGIFNNASEANQAVEALTSSGFNRDQIDVASRGSNAGSSTTTSTTDSYYTGDRTNTGEGITDSIGNFFNSLFGGTEHSAHANTYSEVARRSNSIVTVHANSAEQAQTAAHALDRFGAIDVDEQYENYGSSSSSTATSSTSLTADTATARTTEATGDISVPVIEEQLAVGKREVESGAVRVRSRVIERPVEESVRLREEHVFVHRNPVNRSASEADFNTFGSGEVVITERDEVPVVAKEARVVEEVSIGKDVTERTETISDTVRRTDVEVEEIDTNLDTNRTGTSNQ